jgi:hypothetical protein
MPSLHPIDAFAKRCGLNVHALMPQNIAGRRGVAEERFSRSAASLFSGLPGKVVCCLRFQF